MLLGATAPGSSDIYSGAATATPAPVAITIPANGQPFYATLKYLLNGGWWSIHYTFTEGP